ncbi:MAG: hypothetical protein AAB262_14775 [Elusimicrobiota bacterium]
MRFVKMKSSVDASNKGLEEMARPSGLADSETSVTAGDLLLPGCQLILRALVLMETNAGLVGGFGSA